MIKKLICILLTAGSIVLSSVQPAVAANSKGYYIKSYGVEEGLSQSMVYCILQDSKGFIWLGTQDGLNRFDGKNFKIYKNEADKSGSIGSNSLFSLYEHKDGKLWVGTAKGIYIYDPLLDSFERLDVQTSDGQKIEGVARQIKGDKEGNVWIQVDNAGVFRLSEEGELRNYLPLVNGQLCSNIRDFHITADGNLWLGTYGAGLICIDTKNGESESYLYDSRNVAGNDVNTVHPLNHKVLLVGTVAKGVQYFDTETKAFYPLIETDKGGKPLFVRRIITSSVGDLWIGTEAGVYIYNPKSASYIVLDHTYNDSFSLSDNAVHSLFEDADGGIWIGTFFGGVNYIGPNSSSFEKFYPISGRNSISGKSISEFCLDGDGQIWIGTEDAGLNRFNPQSREFENGIIPAKNIHALMYSQGEMWVGTFSEGLYRIDVHTGKTEHYINDGKKDNSLKNNNIYALSQDNYGDIYVGTSAGLQKYNRRNNSFSSIEVELIDAQVTDIADDERGKMWIATAGKGLFSYDKNSGRWKNYYSDRTHGSSMVSCLLLDSRQRLWVGTEGAGIGLYNRDNDSVRIVYTMQNGLPNDCVYKLLEDKKGYIWGSTNKGLFCLDSKDGSIRKYTVKDGLLGDQFNYKSGLRTDDGKLYFGGIKGFVAFSPEMVRNEGKVNETNIVFNSFQIWGEEVVPGDGSVLSNSISYTKEIRLSHKQNSFTIGFASLNYGLSNEESYSYILDGWDKEWINCANPQQISYSNVPAGKYSFMVQVAGGDGIWRESDARLKITILPPLYKSTAACIFYGLLFIALLWLSLKLYSRRAEIKNEEKIKELEAAKEKELYNAKLDFFTNVAHEIRTPLSLIKLPLDEVLGKSDENSADYENLTIMKNNADRLIKLVNELLDFRKTEAGGMQVSFVHTDVMELVRETATRFQPSLKLKGIELSIDAPQQLSADVDKEIFTKLFSNLMNNALKHAASVVYVRIKRSGKQLSIVISNDGDKIPAKYAASIFKPYFKIDEKSQGSGIGLPLAKTLAELHKGSLILDTKDQNLTSFVITLPLEQATVFQVMDKSAAEEEEDFKQSFDSGKQTTVLLVEDNLDFIQFVTKQLASDYNILRAQNGQQALDILSSNENVDIIVTDLMMPVMDGMELSKTIKEELRYSHIPIIMLTAQNNLQYKIESMGIGIDDYIEKPFSADFLKARIENLLAGRRKVNSSYQSSPEVALNTIAHSKPDEEFLDNLVKIINEHLEEVDLNVDMLATAMNMSRATFYRKVKSISELTPNDFIRLIRLKKAAELLQQGVYRVNEIAFIVGFSSASYFAKCFYKQFGVLPKNFTDKK